MFTGSELLDLWSYNDINMSRDLRDLLTICLSFSEREREVKTRKQKIANSRAPSRKSPRVRRPKVSFTSWTCELPEPLIFHKVTKLLVYCIQQKSVLTKTAWNRWLSPALQTAASSVSNGSTSPALGTSEILDGHIPPLLTVELLEGFGKELFSKPYALSDLGYQLRWAEF